MFYKAIQPGAIGHSVQFLYAAAVCKEIGYEGYWFDAGQDFKADLSQTKDLLAQTGLKAAGFGLPLDFRRDLAAFEEGLLNLPVKARYARELGITGCATWILPFHDTLDFEENYALHMERLRLVCEVLQDEGIRLGLEFVAPETMRKGKAHPFIHTLGGILNLCDDIDVNSCGVLLDAYHWHLAGQPLEDFSRLMGQDVVCAHVMDAPAGVPDEDQLDNVRCLPGATGVLNLAEFFAGLSSLAYDGPVVVEPFEPRLARLPFKEAAREVMGALEKVWPKASN